MLSSSIPKSTFPPASLPFVVINMLKYRRKTFRAIAVKYAVFTVEFG